MKGTGRTGSAKDDDLRPEYEFDYSKAIPTRSAGTRSSTRSTRAEGEQVVHTTEWPEWTQMLGLPEDDDYQRGKLMATITEAITPRTIEELISLCRKGEHPVVTANFTRALFAGRRQSSAERQQ